MQSAPDTLRDEIHRKIGRNIILLQRIELALKSFVAGQNFILSVNLQNPEWPSPKNQIEQKREAFARKTMGCVTRLFCEKVLTDSKPHPDSGELARGESRFTFSFYPFHGRHDDQEKFTKRLESVVEDRNRIVHQLLTTFDLSESGNLEEQSIFLDQLHEKANSLFCDLKSFHESKQEIKEYLIALNHSPFPNDGLNNISIQSLIVHLFLYAYQSEKKDTSGWIDLAQAGVFIHKRCHDGYLESRKQYKVGSLKKILIKTEIFDLNDEKGKIFFRIKPEYYIEIDNNGIINFCKQTTYQEGGECILQEELKIQLEIENPFDNG
jgi:hypothetical protein